METDGLWQNPTSGSQSPYAGGPPPQPPQKKPDAVTSVFNTLHGVVHTVGSELAGRLGSQYVPPPSSHPDAQTGQPNSIADPGMAGAMKNRYDSFAGPKNGNDVKWYVDGCSYMYAVSKALESARETIWILDCE